MIKPEDISVDVRSIGPRKIAEAGCECHATVPIDDESVSPETREYLADRINRMLLRAVADDVLALLPDPNEIHNPRQVEHALRAARARIADWMK